LFAQYLVFVGYVKLQKKESLEGFLWYKSILPIGFANACSMASGNAAYLYLNVGFIQMLKSFSPVTIMVVGFFSGIENITISVLLSVIMISIGTYMTCTYNKDFNVIGLFFMLLAEVGEGMNIAMYNS
jgi:hypothetical protein